MKENFRRKVRKISDLTKSPGNLCKSFGINMNLYGEDLTKDTIFIEDRGVIINPKNILSRKRVGINPKLKGSEKKLRFFIK